MRIHVPLLLLCLACGRKEAPPAPASSAPAPAEVAVLTVTLGRAVGADLKVVEATNSFAAKDAIYASVETQGAADKARLEARWTFLDPRGPLLVQEEAMNLTNLRGSRIHAFHIGKQSDWPKGTYQVEIVLNGVAATSKTFTVR